MTEERRKIIDKLAEIGVDAQETLGEDGCVMRFHYYKTHYTLSFLTDDFGRRITGKRVTTLKFRYDGCNGVDAMDTPLLRASLLDAQKNHGLKQELPT